MAHPIQALLAWALVALAAYGYRIVLLFTTLENVFIVGSFTPGDVITASAAVVATTQQGARLSPWLLIATATVGCMIGTNISYLIGRRGGRDLIERLGPRFGINTSTIEATEEYFAKHGYPTVFLARFVAVLKNVAPAVAGALRMNVFWFEFYSLLSAIAYSSLLVAAGWFLGENFRIGLRYFGVASWLLFVAVVGAGVWLWVRKRRHDRQLMVQNAARYQAEHPDEEEDAR